MTLKERAAMQQALEALELAIGSHGVMLTSYPPHDAWQYRRCDFKLAEAITALREALAEPDIEEMTLTQIAARHEQAEQEPVARVIGGVFEPCNDDVLSGAWELYAAPVRTKDLTDDEIMKINVDTAGIVPTCDRQFHFARAVIQEYRRKNGIV